MIQTQSWALNSWTAPSSKMVQSCVLQKGLDQSPGADLSMRSSNLKHQGPEKKLEVGLSTGLGRLPALLTSEIN